MPTSPCNSVMGRTHCLGGTGFSPRSSPSRVGTQKLIHYDRLNYRGCLSPLSDCGDLDHFETPAADFLSLDLCWNWAVKCKVVEFVDLSFAESCSRSLGCTFSVLKNINRGFVAKCQGHSSLDTPSELNPPQRIPSLLFVALLVPQAEGQPSY